VISSRRLAREWALKILYQMDVGKVSLEEARDTAMERLRKEFVQRGSRTASGSPLEEICLEHVTSALVDTLRTMRTPFERALLNSMERALSAAPYWQEIWCEKALKSRFKGLKLEVSHLVAPVSELPVYSAESGSGAGSSVAPDLSSAERARIDSFMRDMFENLPAVLAAEMRIEAKQFALELYQGRQAGLPGYVGDFEFRQLLHKRRMELNSATAERFQKISQVVRKQTADWLSVAVFTVKLVDGMAVHQDELDQMLTDLSSGWKLQRQVAVDRNILRLAGMEIIFLPGIPASASINEAVELAKKYSTAESGRFVNGVLGAIASRVGEKSKPAPESTGLEMELDDELIEDLPEIADLEPDLPSDLAEEAAEQLALESDDLESEEISEDEPIVG